MSASKSLHLCSGVCIFCFFFVVVYFLLLSPLALVYIYIHTYIHIYIQNMRIEISVFMKLLTTTLSDKCRHYGIVIVGFIFVVMMPTIRIVFLSKTTFLFVASIAVVLIVVSFHSYSTYTGTHTPI